jgi:N-acetylglutamate synthase/N-acetylornithine aminotransferase
MKLINTGTSTRCPITVTNAARHAMPKITIASAIVSSKLLDTAVNESEVEFW